MALRNPGKPGAGQAGKGKAAGIGLRLAAALTAFALTAGCATQVRHHGYAPDDSALAQIQIGRDTRETVAAAIGRPSTAGVLGESGWYYVGSRWEHFGPRPPVEVEREVVAISFDGRGRVANVERFGLEQGEVVPLSRRITESQIRGEGLVTQLLRNVGRVSAADFVDDGRRPR
jgi:outer membrane protein assembly factor BamE (lipoprotein component of BamABCDE complex)